MNFKTLCTGEKGVSESTGVHLTYLNSLIHRVVLGGWIQAGDIVNGAGSGGESIYGPTFDGKHRLSYFITLSMFVSKIIYGFPYICPLQLTTSIVILQII